jgi:hypothetical protein
MTSISPSVSAALPRAQSFRIPPEKLATIPCPNLRTLVNEGWLTPDKDGNVDLKQLDDALKRLGVEALPRKILVGGGEKATHETVAQLLGPAGADKFNVYSLNGTNLDHAGDTGTLRGGFNKERLDWMCSFADKNGRIGMPEISAIQKVSREREATTFRDKALGVVELTALLKVYGTPDANGKKSISVDGLRSLFERAQFPDEWRKQLTTTSTGALESPERTGMLRLIGGIVQMAYHQIGTPSGRARMAMDMALGKDTSLQATSAAGLSASLCPAGPPVATGRGQVDAAHAKAG